MNLWNKKLIISLLLLTFLFPVSLSAQSDTLEISTRQRKLRLGPFFWFVGFKGSIYKPPIPSNYPEPAPPRYDVDLSFRDISANLKFAIMFSSEFRNKNTTFRTSFSSIVLKGKAIAPIDVIFEDITYRLGYFAGDFSAGRTIHQNNKLRIDALFGFKWTNISISGSTDLFGNVPFEGNRTKLWIDPMLGTDLLYEPIKRLEIHAYADIGAFIGSEFTYQYLGEVNYYVNSWFYLTYGYRVWAIEVEPNQAIYTGQIKGMVLRLGFLL